MPVSYTHLDVYKRQILYIVFLLPAPLLYYWLVGYPYYMQPQWFKFLTKFMPNSFFNMAPMNSLMLFNGVVGVIFLVLYVLVFFLFAKKSGYTVENTGLKLPVVNVWKSLLLAVVSFGPVSYTHLDVYKRQYIYRFIND